jgi:deoxyribose-phosphate aldolase
MAVIKQIYSLIDLTSLNETDDAQTIAELCTKAALADVHVAAVCIYPRFVPQVKEALRGTAVKIATVVNFPGGDDSLESAETTIQTALSQGVDEIDVVFPYARYLAGEKAYAETFIRRCKSLCAEQVLKVILETGVLQASSVIKEVSELVIAAGADFLKTSTGKTAVGATVEAAAVMLDVIQNKSQGRVGLKVSGGIRTIAQAIEYITLAENKMGPSWLTPAHFRIGASQLVDSMRANYLA